MARPISPSNCQPTLSLPFFVTIAGTSRQAATGLDEQHAGQREAGLVRQRSRGAAAF